MRLEAAFGPTASSTMACPPSSSGRRAILADRNVCTAPLAQRPGLPAQSSVLLRLDDRRFAAEPGVMADVLRRPRAGLRCHRGRTGW